MTSSIFGSRYMNIKEALRTEDGKTKASRWKISHVKAGNPSFENGIHFAGECRPDKVVDANFLQRSKDSWTALISQHIKCGETRQALRTYEQMRKDGVEPSPRTVIAALKACSRLQDLESAKRIHSDIVRSGLDSDLHVGTMLLDTYTKCKSLSDARHVFDRMPCRDVVSWTSMILGYAHMNLGEEALQLYTQMQQEGVEPNDRTYVSALKACSSLAALEGRHGRDGTPSKQRCMAIVRAIHADVRKGNFDSDVFVSNMLVDVYAKCGHLEDARRLFEQMPYRDVVSWNTMIFGYAQMGQGDEGLQLFARMQQGGTTPDGWTYVSALKACSSLAESENHNEENNKAATKRCLVVIKAIHTEVLKKKVEINGFVGNMLVDAYAKCGSLEDARCVFENVTYRNVVSWNAMILGYAQTDNGQMAMQLFTRMQTEGVMPNDRTYVSALKACSTLAKSEEENTIESLALRRRCLDAVRAIHSRILKAKFETDVYVGTMLVDVYARCGSLETARIVFENMPHRSVVSWNAMIFGYTQAGEGEESLHLFTRMQQEGVVPDGWTYVSVLKACSGLLFFEERKGGVSIDRRKRCLETVRSIHSTVVNAKFESEGLVGNILVDAYAKCGSMEDARSVFDKIQNRDVVAWTAMIWGCTQVHEGETALELFAQMKQEGVAPNERTYVSALKACGSVAGLEKGKDIHAEILKAGVEATQSFVASSLIDMYGKCGSMVDAQQVFDTLSTRDIVAWSALIAGYAHQGESGRVFHLFQRMKDEGIQPDGITCLAVLTACSHVGLVERGQKYFEAITQDYGITLTMEHYTCMADLLGRAGEVAKAVELVRSIPFQSDSTVWICVMSACRKWKNVELGRQAFECAVRLDKSDAAAYVLMSNIYLAAHMGEEAKKIQEIRLQSQAWKQPGQSRWTDIMGLAHVFVVGDQGHPESQEIHVKLEDLVLKMKREGSIGHLDSVLPDTPGEEREDAWFGHSEGLAIAYALLHETTINRSAEQSAV